MISGSNLCHSCEVKALEKEQGCINYNINYLQQSGGWNYTISCCHWGGEHRLRKTVGLEFNLNWGEMKKHNLQAYIKVTVQKIG